MAGNDDGSIHRDSVGVRCDAGGLHHDGEDANGEMNVADDTESSDEMTLADGIKGRPLSTTTCQMT